MKNSDFGCQRCDAYHAVDGQLLGRVSVRLCKDCSNDWRDRCEALPAYRRLHDLELRARCLTVAAEGVRNIYDEVKPIQDETASLLEGPIRAAATAFAAEHLTRSEASRVTNAATGKG